MKEFKCHTCNFIFKSKKIDKNRIPKYCSRRCYANREITKEWIEKISNAKKGKIPWNKGVEMWKDKPHPRGTLGKKGLNKGRIVTEETRKKLRESQLGKEKKCRIIQFTCLQCNEIFKKKSAYKNYIPKYCSIKCYALAIRKPRFCEKCGEHVKWSNHRFCSKKCYEGTRKGIPLSLSHRNALRGARPHMREHNSYNYTGNTKYRILDMGRSEYRNWRKAVYERDNYTCQICKEKGKFLNTDHIKPYSCFPELRYNIENGRTLCKECHTKTDTYGYKAKNYRKYHA